MVGKQCWGWFGAPWAVWGGKGVGLVLPGLCVWGGGGAPLFAGAAVVLKIKSNSVLVLLSLFFVT